MSTRKPVIGTAAASDSPASSAKSRQQWMAVSVLAVAAALIFVGATARAEDASSPATKGPQVAVVTVGDQAVGAAAIYDGSLQAVRQTVLSAQASGRVMELRVKAGDPVKAGQIIAIVDDRATMAGVAQAQAGMAEAQANFANAKSQFERTQELRKQGFVAQAALDTAQAALRAAEAGVAAARAGQTQSALAQGFTRLTAPYDGWVLQTHVESGALAMPGTPIATVYAPQPMRAVVHVPASRQGAAASAQQIQVRLPGEAGQWVKPESTTTVPAADPVSQTVEWRLNLSAEDGKGQVPGRQVQVRFVTGEAQRLVVPEGAILRRGELTGVYVATARAGGAQGFALRTVRVGQAQDGKVEVLAGLKTGDRVATDPVKAGLAGATPSASAAAQ